MNTGNFRQALREVSDDAQNRGHELDDLCLEIKGVAEYLTSTLPDRIAIAAGIELIDAVLDDARELAEYAEQLINALEETLGVGPSDLHALRLAQGILRALPQGVDA
jgi:hypothetical protein